MNTLFLFLTQAEGGAPGYLSRLGEDAALNLAENLAQFMQAGLRLDFASGSERRAALLSDQSDTAPAPLSQKEGVALALRLHPEVLLFSGGSVRSKKTIAPLAEALALPIIEVGPLDLEPDVPERRKQPSGVAQFLELLFTEWLESATASELKLVVVQTSVGSFLNWLEGGIVAPSKLVTLKAAILEVSENDRVPAVTVAAHQGAWPGGWHFDLTDG